jgi:hypothetical protein
MRTEQEIRQELKAVRDHLEKYRANECDDTEMLYGAQQALGWVLNELRAPSEVEDIIHSAAKVLT